MSTASTLQGYLRAVSGTICQLNRVRTNPAMVEVALAGFGIMGIATGAKATTAGGVGFGIRAGDRYVGEGTSVNLIRQLLQAGALLHLDDPQAMKTLGALSRRNP